VVASQKRLAQCRLPLYALRDDCSLPPTPGALTA
jgi:hypothetical protein